MYGSIVITFLSLALGTSVFQLFVTRHLANFAEVNDGTPTNRWIANAAERKKFEAFQLLQATYCKAYFFAVFGDWLQGPYVYQLYASYRFSETAIAVLFVIGFASSSTFGSFTGPLADRFGRKRMTMAFCLIYSASCLIKLSSNFHLLVLGRLLGGIATSLLHTVFEAWYVSEHLVRLGHPAAWLRSTFAYTTKANAYIAIMAGLVGYVFADAFGFGPVAPFLISIVSFGASGYTVWHQWGENFGHQTDVKSARESRLPTSLVQTYRQGWHIVMADQSIFSLGLIQSVFESCMYIFVFLWTPVLSHRLFSTLPLGLVFACFMLAIVAGSTLFKLLTSATSIANRYSPGQALRLANTIFAVAMLALCITMPSPYSYSISLANSWLSLTTMRLMTFFAFLAIEFAVGIYFPAMACLRSALVPESHRTTIGNIFRIPMNVITCAVLVFGVALAGDKRLIFALCGMLLSLCGQKSYNHLA